MILETQLVWRVAMLTGTWPGFRLNLRATQLLAFHRIRGSFFKLK
jgi:hypothetical protein